MPNLLRGGPTLSLYRTTARLSSASHSSFITSPPRSVIPLFTESPTETVRKGVRGASEASILVAPSNEIELLGPVSSVFEASVRSLSGLFGQSQKEDSRKPIYRMLDAYPIGPAGSPFPRTSPVLWVMHLATRLDGYSVRISLRKVAGKRWVGVTHTDEAGRRDGPDGRLPPPCTSCYLLAWVGCVQTRGILETT